MHDFSRYIDHRGNLVYSNVRSRDLEGFPEIVVGNCEVMNCGLISLKGGPKRVDGSFVCSLNELTSLQYAPKHIGGDFNCYMNKISSLKDIHKTISYIGGDFFAYGNGIVRNILGLLLIDGLERVLIYGRSPSSGGPVEQIMNKYLDNTNMDKFQKLMLCQDELIEAGFEQLARL